MFIASPVSVLTGDAARVALETTNDAAYLTPGKGVLSVPLERWQQAQQYERDTWLTYGLSATEDRNAEHAALFDHYQALPEKLGAVIELGCGPFTNVREILSRDHTTKSKVITLVDPLAKTYQEQHPNCAYKDGKLHGLIAMLEPKAIEDYATDITFDTLIMVNVLSHCRDAARVFERIHYLLRKGGYLVFGEPARDIDPEQLYDVGHPLSYTQAVIDEFLSDFKEKYRNGNYFIGVKK